MYIIQFFFKSVVSLFLAKYYLDYHCFFIMNLIKHIFKQYLKIIDNYVSPSKSLIISTIFFSYPNKLYTQS